MFSRETLLVGKYRDTARHVSVHISGNVEYNFTTYDYPYALTRTLTLKKGCLPDDVHLRGLALSGRLYFETRERRHAQA